MTRLPEGADDRVGAAFLRAADALARGALLLRDHFLSEAMSG